MNKLLQEVAAAGLHVDDDEELLKKKFKICKIVRPTAVN